MVRMTKRKEFPKSVRVAVLRRSGGICEADGCENKGPLEFDHICPSALGGEATVENCQALCGPCHRRKTFGTPATTAGSDVASIRKADRIRKKHSEPRKPGKIQSRGFPSKQERARLKSWKEARA